MKDIDYTYSEENIKISEKIKEKAFTLGADLVGIITAQSIDTVPSHFRQWDDFYQNPAYTKKTIDYLEDTISVVVLGFQVWDDIHEAFVSRGEEMETLGYMRMRLPTRDLHASSKALGIKRKELVQRPFSRRNGWLS